MRNIMHSPEAEPEYVRGPEKSAQETEVFEVNGEKVKVIDVIPEKVKDPIPAILLPGWGTSPELYKRNINELARYQRRVLSIETASGIEDSALKVLPGAEGVPEVEMRRISALISVMEKKKLDLVDIVGHSYGGMYAAFGAMLRPEKFRNIVLVNPAGIVGPDSSLQLLQRASIEALQEAMRGMKEKSLRDSLIHIASHSASTISTSPFHACREVIAIANTEIHNTLAFLKEKGVHISIIHTIDDATFPMERVQKIVDAGHIDGFYSAKGGHNEFILNPEKYTKLVDEALSSMEKSRKKAIRQTRKKAA